MVTTLNGSAIWLQSPETALRIDVITAENVLWSSGSAWRGLVGEAYRFEDLETPLFQTVDHLLVLHLSPPAPVRFENDGRCHTLMRVPGDLSIIPAATTCRVFSRVPHGVLAVSLTQQAIVPPEFDIRQTGPFFLSLRLSVRDPQLEHICRALQAEAESNYPSGPLYGDSLGLALGAHLLTHYGASSPLATRTGGMAPQALRRVIDYIEGNLDNPIRMSSLAEIAGLSRYRFAHNFRSTIGVSPHKYVLRKRLARAKQLLRETNRPILEIAYSVGCQSSSHFNFIFRRETGTIPSAYRTSFQ